MGSKMGFDREVVHLRTLRTDAADRVKKYLFFCRWGSPYVTAPMNMQIAMNWLLRSHNEGPPLRIGLALTGTLQMRVAHSPVVAVVAQ